MGRLGRRRAAGCVALAAIAVFASVAGPGAASRTGVPGAAADNRRGGLFVLIGRATFSAAGNFAADADPSTHAAFVGEPTGGGVRMYGDAVPVELPNSGLQAQIPTRYWDYGKGPKDNRLAVQPDVKVALTSADYFTRRDSALAVALAAS